MYGNKKNILIFILAFAVLSTPFIINELSGQYIYPIEISGLINMKFPINTPGDDFSPTLTSDGKIMLFNSKGLNDKSSHIYASRFLDGRWTTPVAFDEINSKYDNDETPFISPDGNMIIFSSDREGSMRPDTSFYGEERITYDLYFSKKVDGKWTKPERLPGDVNTIENERSPSLSQDMTTLYYTRWPFKNIKKAAIMQATFKNGMYTDVRELPSPVNTGNYEIAISPSYKRPGFYFSSRRPKGLGGWDVYFAYFINGQFSKVVNMGPEINSDSNELFFTEVGDKIYFCSNREGGAGLYDIYTADIKKINIEDYPVIKEKNGRDKATDKEKIKDDDKKDKTGGESKQVNKEIKPVKTEDKTAETREKTVKSDREIIQKSTATDTKLNVKVVKRQEEIPLSVKINISQMDSDDQDRKELESLTRKSDSNGVILITPKDDARWIVLKPAQGGYKPFRKIVKIEKGKTQDILLELTPLPPVIIPKKKAPVTETREKQESHIDDDSRFTLKPIYFAFNSSEIKLQEYPYVHRVINYLRKNKSVRLKIAGHSDRFGTKENNEEVSIGRAKTVRDYLVKLGIEPERLEISGMGSAYPSSLNGRGKFPDYNRRVEFKTIDSLLPNGYD